MIEETLCKEAKREKVGGGMGENLAKLFPFILFFPFYTFQSKW
jgi:hypothetical protein